MSKAKNVGDLDSPEAKLSWIFTAFDADGGGTIDSDEIRWHILLPSSSSSPGT